MSKAEWVRHADEVGRDVVKRAEHQEVCPTCKARRRTRKANRIGRERNSALRSLGMTRTAYGWE